MRVLIWARSHGDHIRSLFLNFYRERGGFKVNRRRLKCIFSDLYLDDTNIGSMERGYIMVVVNSSGRMNDTIGGYAKRFGLL